MFMLYYYFIAGKSVTQGIENAIDSANLSSISNTCTSLLLYPDGGNVAETIARESNRKRHMSDDADIELEWETTKFFKLVIHDSF